MSGGTVGDKRRRLFRGPGEGGVLLLAAGLGLTLAVALLLGLRPAPVRQAELVIYDAMLAARPAPQPTGVPVLVGIDEESLAAFGQWPWPRYRLAMLVERLQRRGASVVALDFLMPEPDRTSPELIRMERQRDGLEPRTRSPSVGRDSNSVRLAEVLGRGSTVLGYDIVFAAPTEATLSPSPPTVPPGMTVIGDPGSTAGWPRAAGAMRSVPVLTAAATAEGFTNAVHDADGVLRRVPLLLPIGGSQCPSLALSALLLSSPERTLRLTRVGGESFVLWRDRRIPVDGRGNLLLDFRADRGRFPYISARAVLGDAPGLGSLDGRIVLVGAWAKGLGDTHATPIGKSVNGLEVHATVIDDILAGTFVSRPGWARGAELAAILFLGGATTLLLRQSGFRLALAFVVAATAGCYWGSRYLLVARGVYLAPLLPMAAPIVVTMFLSLVKYGIAARRLRQRTRDLIQAQDTIILGMSALAETRDRETGGHILRTRRYVHILARHLARTPKYAHLNANDVDLLGKSAPLHDIGKVGIPDSVLNKAGKLTDAEYDIMKTHTLIGAAALTRVVDGSGHPEKQDFLDYARQMIESHHERWDGAGYPHGLRGEAIPLGGRLMALADVYDALVSRRVYKQGLSHQQAMDFIIANAGTQFDPDIVHAFVATSEQFLEVSRLIGDEHEADGSPAPVAS